MNKFFLFLSSLFILLNSNAQVKIGAPGTPDVNAVLELAGTTKGLLLPRLALTNTSNPSPLSAFTAGMVVYNTAFVSDVRPGYYYSDGFRWRRIFSSTDAWSLSGNTETISNVNFIGTTDSMGLSIGTYNTRRMYVSPTGDVTIGIVGMGLPPSRLVIEGSISGDLASNIGLVGTLSATANGQTLYSIFNFPSLAAALFLARSMAPITT